MIGKILQTIILESTYDFIFFYMCFYTTRAMFWGIMKQLHHIKTLSMHWWKRNSQLPRRKNGCYNKRQGDLWIAILSAIDSLCEMHMCLWGNNTTKVSSIVSGEENAMSKGCWLNATWVGTAELFKPVDKQSEAREARWPHYKWTQEEASEERMSQQISESVVQLNQCEN